MAIALVFENEHFIAVDKPAGYLTIPGREGDKDVRPCLSTQLATEYGRVFVVHRLDFEVSGLVLFARAAQSHREANRWFEERKVRKTYEAITEGSADSLSPGQEFFWQSKLLRGKKRAYESDAGKESKTKAQFIQTQDGLLHWRLEPLTGRGHQLRYELAKHGYPICGDMLYGAHSKFENTDAAIALRAVKLDFSACGKIREELRLPEHLAVKGLFS